MKEKTPSIDIQGHLVTNTCVFKENLKLITNSVIENVWKDKLSPDNIKQTIQKAIYDTYKGNFDEIKELDEEQLYNSWINSEKATDRIMSDNNMNSSHINDNFEANSTNLQISQVKPDKTLIVSEIYEQDENVGDNKNTKQNKLEVNSTPGIKDSLEPEKKQQQREHRSSRSMKNYSSIKKISNSEILNSLRESDSQVCLSNSSRTKNRTEEIIKNPYFVDSKREKPKMLNNSMKLRCLTKVSNKKKNLSCIKPDFASTQNYIKKSPTVSKRDKFGTHLNGSFKKENLFKYKKMNSTDDRIQSVLKESKTNNISKQHNRNVSANSFKKKQKEGNISRFKYEYSQENNKKFSINKKMSLTPNMKLFY